MSTGKPRENYLPCTHARYSAARTCRGKKLPTTVAACCVSVAVATWHACTPCLTSRSTIKVDQKPKTIACDLIDHMGPSSGI